MSENLYANRARYYEILYRDKDYRGEVDFILEKFEEFSSSGGKRVLVLGCGTGGHSRHLVEEGFEVTGLDKYESMLEIAREKSGANFRQTDLPDINVEGEFDLILMPFTIVNHLPEKALLKTLENISSVLKEDGVLIFDNGDFWLEESKDHTVPILESRSRDGENVARISQLQSEEEGLRFKSLIFTEEGFFPDEHQLFDRDDKEIRQMLKEKGFKYEIFENGYGTDSSKDNGTVFVARLES